MTLTINQLAKDITSVDIEDIPVENIEPTDVSVHFAFTGQICEQIKNLPDGTKVNITVKR
jgi:hypothetical protein